MKKAEDRSAGHRGQSGKTARVVTAVTLLGVSLGMTFPDTAEARKRPGRAIIDPNTVPPGNARRVPRSGGTTEQWKVSKSDGAATNNGPSATERSQAGGTSDRVKYGDITLKNGSGAVADPKQSGTSSQWKVEEGKSLQTGGSQ